VSAAESVADRPLPLGRGALRLNLIRDFEVSCGDELVEMSPNSQRLLSFVALHDRPIRRAQVRATLWMDSSDDRANASLRSALWRVPVPHGRPLLHASPTHLWLDPDVDVDFRSIIARARSMLADPAAEHDPPAALDVARELSAFGDDLLPDWYDDWVIMERERFHHLRLQALDALGERLAELGRLADALLVGLAAVQAEPLRESAHRLVIRIHLRQGNVADAVRQFRGYERLLLTELRAQPTAQIRELVAPCLGRGDFVPTAASC
jgi:DNA-binding SARP family transcriptional activator